MNIERLNQIKEIYHAALEIALDEREAFFKESCGADDHLRHEVESLLAFENTFDSLLDTPPESLAAEMFAEREQQSNFVSKEIGHYRIVSKIGAGGMGEVYLAEDTKLDRRVALKILPAEFAEDKDRMSRFVREAKSASALNHPNIITIHEIGESDGTHFIATEFIDGKTLNEYAKSNPLNFKSALEIAIQIASALDEAHSAGIVHRDIKPDNVMIRKNGLAKILDFGIAKLSAPLESDAEAATAIKSGTSPGMIIGTPNYMSPEQARGREVDQQTDIFSFGVVLYEMLAGSSPFAGETVSDIIAAVLMKEPQPLTNIPPELAAIVQQTLQKDKQKRYKSAKDLLDDLTEVKQELEIQSRLERTSSPNLEEPKTQILQAPTTAEKSTGSTTDSEEGFWVAVLPFKYRGANADLEALAEGLSEEIITGMSRFSYLRVVAQGSALRFTGELTDIRTVGKELGARYVLEGNLRQAGNKLRLAVRLVDAATGGNLWAENFERDFSPDVVFELQDDLVPRIVSTCADHFGVLVRSISDTVRGKDARHLSPYEALMRGFGYHYLLSPQDHAEAREVLEKAVEESPNNADCWAMLSWIYSHEYGHGFNPRPGSLDRAIAAARRAVELAPSNHLAYQTLAVAHFFRKEKAACLSAAERALSLNPLDASNEAIFLITFADDWERGCALIRRAMEINPHCPGWYRLIVGLNEYRKTNYREAAAEAVKANATGGWADVVFAAIYGQLGEHAAARDAVQNLIAAKMDSLEAVRELGAKWFDPQLVEHLLEGIGKAGLKTVSTQNSEEPKTQILKAQTTAEEKPTEAETQNSIAVLPFTNMSADEENEYFCDGLAEELLNALSKIEDLKVAARTSAFSFKGKNANISEIGEKLSVKNVLEGSVRKSGNKIRISVRLENVKDGYQLWAESYDREMEDIFDVQDEISLAVVDTLKLQLFGDEKAAVLKRGTQNTEAYQLYLKGRYHFARRTFEDMQKGIDYFEQAIKLDPEYALAFVGIADIYNSWTKSLLFPAKEVIPKAKSAAKRALEIDPKLAEAHAALADSLAIFDWNWSEAEHEFKRAIELNPRVSYIHFTYGISYLVPLGRTDEAIAELKRAVELEPLSLIANSILAEVYLYAHEYEKALDQAKIAYDLNPNFTTSAYWLGHAFLANGMYEEAITLSESSLQNIPSFPVFLYLAGQTYAKSGRKREAEQIIGELREISKTKYVQPYSIARIYAALGDKDKAFGELEKAFEQRDWWLPRLKTDPLMDPLRNDPRCNDLLGRMGFSTEPIKQTDESLEAKTVMLSVGEVTSEPPAKDLETENAETKPTTEPATNAKSEIQKPKSKWWLFGLLSLIVFVGGFFGYKYLSPTNKQINSIAVLPFENKSSDADTDYLSDGLAESLIYRLSQIPNLKVSPTSSVFRYKGKATDPQIIANELGVDSVMTGRITQRGDNLTISVNLVDTRNGKSLWGEQYERKMSELLATQREIAAEITNNLKLKLSGEGEQKLAKKYTDNNEAYQLYLKGRYHYAKRTKEDILKAIEYYKQAVALDPNFALAYVEISDTYATMPAYPYLSPKEAAPQAKAAARKALEIDFSLAEAHTALGFSLVVFDWNWSEAKREFEKALELNPNLSFAHFRYGWNYLSPTGRSREAITEMKRALELEPLSLVTNTNLAIIYADARQNDSALAQARKIYDLEPNFPTGRWALSQAYIVNGMYADAIELNEKSLQTAPTNQLFLRFAGYAYAKSGRRQEAEEIINRFRELSKTQYVMSYRVANIYAALGEKDKAFTELEKAFENHDWELFRLKVDPLMDSLRDDPRFKDLLKRMNLPE